MKRTAPRVSDRAADFYAANFATLNAGLEYVLDAFPTLYRLTVADVKKRFSQSELLLICDTFNGTMLSPMLAGRHMILSVKDACNLEGLDVKWKVNKENLLTRIRELSQWETACLEIWARAFWESGAHETPQEYVAA